MNEIECMCGGTKGFHASACPDCRGYLKSIECVEEFFGGCFDDLVKEIEEELGKEEDKMAR